MLTIRLGSRYRDKVTRFEGVAIGRTEWLTGCATVGLQMEADEKGAVPDPRWIDETRLEEVEAPRVKIDDGRNVGGPQPSPRKMSGTL